MLKHLLKTMVALLAIAAAGDSLVVTAPASLNPFDNYGDWTNPADNKAVWSGTAANAVTLGTVFTDASDLNSIVFTLIDD